jgi:hypothetical protein
MEKLPEIEPPKPKFKVLYSEGKWNDIEVIGNLIYFKNADGRFFVVNADVFTPPNNTLHPNHSETAQERPASPASGAK